MVLRQNSTVTVVITLKSIKELSFLPGGGHLITGGKDHISKIEVRAVQAWSLDKTALSDSRPHKSYHYLLDDLLPADPGCQPGQYSGL